MAADKEITMLLMVNLECERCKKKIKRVLQKIKDKMNIKTTSFEDERNVVKISGPFDAEKVRRKLCCEAGKIIMGFEVMDEEENEDEDEGEEEDDDEDEEEERKPAVVPTIDEINLHPLLVKMLERPARPQPAPCKCSCGCTCRKQMQITRPPAQGVAVPSVWPAPARSISGHGYEAPSPYYGMPVYSIEGWY